jgi:hypothetical protein
VVLVTTVVLWGAVLLRLPLETVPARAADLLEEVPLEVEAVLLIPSAPSVTRS